MIHFHGICHGKRDLRYVGGFLEFKKLEFRGLKGQFNANKGAMLGSLSGGQINKKHKNGGGQSKSFKNGNNR